MGQRRLARVRERRKETEEAEDADDEEEQSGGITARLNNLNIETATTEEEAAEGLAAALALEVEEDRGSVGEDEGGGTQQALEALEFLNQEADPSGNMLVESCNGFNNPTCLAMLWTV